MTRGDHPSQDQGTPVAGVPVARPRLASRRVDEPVAGGGTSATFSKALVIGLVALFVVASAAFLVSVGGAGPSPTPASSPTTAALVGAAGDGSPAGSRDLGLLGASPAAGSPFPSADPASTLDPTASASPGASLEPGASPDPLASGDPTGSLGPIDTVDPAALVEMRMPVVPVTGFWSTDTRLGRADLVAALRGESARFDRVLVPTEDREAIAAALGVRIADRVISREPEAITRAVKRRGTLGLLRASDVGYRVRALGIGSSQLFGNDRLRHLGDWPLVLDVVAPAGTAWDQRQTWTLVAGGDSFTDRGIYERVVNRGKGIDYPFDGGTARVTGHYCCGPFVTPGHPVPSYKLSGPKGIVRAMTRDADLAIANHESPIPDDWRFHLHGFVFSGKPALTAIFSRAGIDWMSLANNHIKDFGTDGIADTRKHLTRFGIAFSGAGKNLRQARRFEVLEVKGVRIAILPCVAVAPFSWATKSGGGAVPCKNGFMLPDIRKARAAADVVIVFPHWGVEYDRDPQPSQRKLAAAWVAAGADLVLGAHSHVAGAIEDIDGAPVLYSLGNFIFDQNWATYTMESVLLEATYHGSRLVQMRLHPFLTHDQAQPNFLDPARDDGRALLKAVRRASFVDW